jgi:hypothetical protein
MYTYEQWLREVKYCDKTQYAKIYFNVYWGRFSYERRIKEMNKRDE